MMHCFEFPAKRLARQSNSIQLNDFLMFFSLPQNTFHHFSIIFMKSIEKNIQVSLIYIKKMRHWNGGWTFSGSINWKGQTFNTTSTYFENNNTYPCNNIETEYGIFDGVYLIFQFHHIGSLTVSFSCHDCFFFFVFSFPLLFSTYQFFTVVFFPLAEWFFFLVNFRLFSPTPTLLNWAIHKISTGVWITIRFSGQSENTITENYFI